MNTRLETLRSRLKSRAPLIGTFVKTPSPIVCEVLTHCDFDVICLDAEHAPFGRVDIDGCVAALRAAQQASLVRVSSGTATHIREALDCGATGILVPHVSSPQQAKELVLAARFGSGGRGYSGSTRAAGFGDKSMGQHVADSNSQTVIVAQIEDVSALKLAGDIAAVDGIDAIFIGRADLAVAMGKDPTSPEVMEATASICAAGSAVGTAVGIFTSSLEEIPRWRTAGVSLFLLGSDQSLMVSAGRALVHSFHGRTAKARNP